MELDFRQYCSGLNDAYKWKHTVLKSAYYLPLVVLLIVPQVFILPSCNFTIKSILLNYSCHCLSTEFYFSREKIYLAM